MVNLANIMNLTPHAIKIYNEAGTELVAAIPPSGAQARLDQEPQVGVGVLTTAEGKRVIVKSPQKFGKVSGLPTCGPGGKCPDIVVSMLVGQELAKTGEYAGRVLGPDTGLGAVRKDGRIEGTKWLIEYFPGKAKLD